MTGWAGRRGDGGKDRPELALGFVLYSFLFPLSQISEVGRNEFLSIYYKEICKGHVRLQASETSTFLQLVFGSSVRICGTTSATAIT